MSDKFENIFKERFADLEIAPPPNSWGKISSQIHKPYPYITVIRGITSSIIIAACLLLPNPLDENYLEDYNEWKNILIANELNNNNRVTEENNNLAQFIDIGAGSSKENKSFENRKSAISADKKEIAVTLQKNELVSTKQFENKENYELVKENSKDVNRNLKFNEVVVGKVETENTDLIADEKKPELNVADGNGDNFDNSKIINDSDNANDANNIILVSALTNNNKENLLVNNKKPFESDNENILPVLEETEVSLLNISKFNGKLNTEGLFKAKEIVIVEKERKPFYLMLHFRPQLTYGKTVSNTNDQKIISGIQGSKRVSKDRLGYSLGLGVEKYFSDRFAVSIGFFFDQIKYRTQFDIRNITPDKFMTQTSSDGIAINTVYEVRNESTLFKYNMYNTTIGFKYIFPKSVTNKYLRFSYGFSRLQELSVSNQTEAESIKVEGLGTEINSLLQVSYGFERDFGKNFRINVEPTFSYYFNNLSSNGYHFSLKPYNVGLNFGISYKLW